MLLLILTYHDIPGTMCSLDGSFWQPFSSTVVHDVTISCSKESTLLLIGVTPKPVELKEIKNCSIGLKIFYKIYTIDPIHAAAIFQLLPPKPRSHNNQPRLYADICAWAHGRRTTHEDTAQHVHRIEFENRGFIMLKTRLGWQKLENGRRVNRVYKKDQPIVDKVDIYFLVKIAIILYYMYIFLFLIQKISSWTPLHNSQNHQINKKRCFKNSEIYGLFASNQAIILINFMNFKGS